MRRMFDPILNKFHPISMIQFRAPEKGYIETKERTENKPIYLITLNILNVTVQLKSKVAIKIWNKLL